MLPLVSADNTFPEGLAETDLPTMLPPAEPTSEPGVCVVVKIRVTKSAKALLLAKIAQSDGPTPSEKVSVSIADKPGKVMSTAVASPVVTSMVSVPENGQLEPQLCPSSAVAVPETSAW